MIEDGMCLLLDVDDIDRQVEENMARRPPRRWRAAATFSSRGSPGRSDFPRLRCSRRRRLSAATRMPSLIESAPCTSGRVMLAKLLPRLRPGCSAASSLVWAVMRHAPALLISGEADRDKSVAAAGHDETSRDSAEQLATQTAAAVASSTTTPRRRPSRRSRGRWWRTTGPNSNLAAASGPGRRSPPC